MIICQPIVFLGLLHNNYYGAIESLIEAGTDSVLHC